MSEGRPQKLRRAAKRLVTYVAVAALGSLLATAIFLNQWRSEWRFELWHTAELENEFTRDRADEIRSFEDYVRLEDELFRELDEEVYALTGTGPGFELVRYSEGSASDPRRWSPDWNRSFELSADRPRGAVLLLHGMSDGPYSLRALAETLREQGFWVLGLRLPGHGTVPASLKRIRWEDHAAAVRLGMRHLASRTNAAPVHIVGYSNGAVLALDYVLDQTEDGGGDIPASLVLVSPAIGITPAAALGGRLTALSVLPGLERLAWVSIQPEFDPFRYNSFPLNAGYQVHRLTRSVAARIERRERSEPFPPTLVLLSAVDATVSVQAVVDNLLEHLDAGRHELVLYDINRTSAASSILVADPSPLAAQLLAADTLPYQLTLITNQSPETSSVVVRRKLALADWGSDEPLGVDWPSGLVSLSHIALPFPPDDPLYGRRELQPPGSLPLGQSAVQGETGILRVSWDWISRARHNPFYDYQTRRVLEWMGVEEGAPIVP